MKIKKIKKEENFKEWLDLDVCDDCGSCNSNTYFKIHTQHNKKEILLCNSCIEDILTKQSKE